MTSSQNGQGGNKQDPPGHTPVWRRTLARAVAPPTAEDKPALTRLVRRLTRAQKVIVGLGSLGIALAALLAAPPLGWPLSMLQRGLAALLNLDGDGTADLSGAYPLSVVLQGLVVVGGAVVLWITASWRLGRFPPLTLAVFVTGGVGLLFMANRSPRASLVAWIVIAAFAIAYIHYYRKGRFGYTRGATAAVFSHFTLIAFFIAFPLVLIDVLGGAVASVVDGGPMDAGGEQATDAGQGAAMGGCSVMEMTSQGCPDEVASEPPASEARISLDIDDYPPHDVQSRTGRIEVVTDTTSPRELRALFDLQRAMLDPSVIAEFRDGGLAGEFEELARGLSAGLQQEIETDQAFEVRIRCASVPEAPGVDPVLAIGAFAVTDDAAAQLGLTSADEVLFETSDRRDCLPPAPPAGEVTVDEVLGALERAGLEMTNVRRSMVGGITGDQLGYGPAVGLSTCYAFGCLQQTRTDQLTVTVWPTAEAAEAVIETDSAGAAGGAAALGSAPLTWLGLMYAVADPFNDPAAQFGPVTTVHLTAPNHQTYADALGCRDPYPGSCVEAYLERVEAAATSYEQAAPT